MFEIALIMLSLQLHQIILQTFPFKLLIEMEAKGGLMF